MFLRLISGDAWETIEYYLDYQVSDTTLRSRRNEWTAAGIFDELFETALVLYDEQIGLDCSHVCIDGSVQLAPCGGENTGVAFKSNGRESYKFSLGTDANGIPVGWVLDAGNRNDFVLLEPTLETITDRLSTSHIGTLHLDRGYGYPAVEDRIADFEIDHLNVSWRNKPGQGRTPLIGLKKRWIVERTNSWLTNFKQILRNTDRHTIDRHTALCLASTFLIFYKLADHTQ